MKQIYVGAVSSVDPNQLPIILTYFPHIEQEKDYVNGSTFLLTKSSPNSSTLMAGLEKEMKIDSLAGFGESVNVAIEKQVGRNGFIDIWANIRTSDPLKEAILVAVFEKDGKPVHWQGSNVNNFLLKPNNAGGYSISAVTSIKLSDVRENYQGVTLKTYIWNKGKETFTVEELKVYVRKGNLVVYGLFEPISE